MVQVSSTTLTAGKEFLLQRVAKARSLPEAERSADVAAFLEVQDLLADVCDTLPLPAVGLFSVLTVWLSGRHDSLQLQQDWHVCGVHYLLQYIVLHWKGLFP